MALPKYNNPTDCFHDLVLWNGMKVLDDGRIQLGFDNLDDDAMKDIQRMKAKVGCYSMMCKLCKRVIVMENDVILDILPYDVFSKFISQATAVHQSDPSSKLYKGPNRGPKKHW